MSKGRIEHLVGPTPTQFPTSANCVIPTFSLGNQVDPKYQRCSFLNPRVCSRRHCNFQFLFAGLHHWQTRRIFASYFISKRTKHLIIQTVMRSSLSFKKRQHFGFLANTQQRQVDEKNPSLRNHMMKDVAFHSNSAKHHMMVMEAPGLLHFLTLPSVANL